LRVSVRRPRIAVLDDDEEFAELMQVLLEEEGLAYVRAAPAKDGDDPVAALATCRADAAVVSLRPPDGGVAIIKAIRAHPKLRRLPVLVCSADIQLLRQEAGTLAALENVAALEKPFRIDALAGALERLLAGSLHPPSLGAEPDTGALQALEAWLARLGATLRWPVLDAWVPDARPGMLRCAAAWAASAKLNAFAQVSRRTLLPFGGGLPGRIWVSGRAAWVEDLADDLNFPRLPTARRTGLVSAAAVPVLESGAIVGVVAGYDQRLRGRDVAELERLRMAAEDAGPILRAAAGHSA
jgi:CheY-like chemotaxis protein